MATEGGRSTTALELSSEGPAMPTVSYYGGGIALTNQVLWVSVTRRADLAKTQFFDPFYGFDDHGELVEITPAGEREIYDRALFSGQVYSLRIGEELWRTSTIPDVRLFGIAASDSTIVAGADRGRVVVSRDRGNSWRIVELDGASGVDLVEIAILETGRFLAADEGRRFLASSADGLAWVPGPNANPEFSGEPNSATDEFTYQAGAPGHGLDPARWGEAEGDESVGSLLLDSTARAGLTYAFSGALDGFHYVARPWLLQAGPVERDWTVRAKVVMSTRATAVDEQFEIELGIEVDSTRPGGLGDYVYLGLGRMDFGDGLEFELRTGTGDDLDFHPAKSTETLLIGYTASTRDLWLGALGPTGATNILATVSIASWELDTENPMEIWLYGQAVTLGDEAVRITDLGNYFDSFSMQIAEGGVGPVPLPAITSPSEARGTRGQAFAYQITASNGPTAFGATGLPPGLTLNPVTGWITGVPGSPGNFAATITASNSGGTGSRALSISVEDIPTAAIEAEHRSSGHVPGGGATVEVRLIHPGGLTALGYELRLPPGWAYASDTSLAAIKPSPGQQGVLEWGWFTGFPTSPAEFSVNLRVPAGETGPGTIQGLMIARRGGPEIRAQAQPDPLEIPAFNPFHSADTNRDWRFSLGELLRVVSLYNFSAGNQRTGELHRNAASVDGFDPGPGDRNGPRHSADQNGDWRISLLELMRVVSLYNYAANNQRTGEYQPRQGTEDGYGAGPTSRQGSADAFPPNNPTRRHRQVQ